MVHLTLPSGADLVTTGDTTPKYGVGDLYVDEASDKAYRYVQNNHASTALDPAVAAFWDGVTGKSYGQVQPVNITSKGGPAGQPLAALAAQKFGWIQVRGRYDGLTTVTATITAGKAAMVGQADGKYVTQTAGNAIVAVNDGPDVTVGTGKTLRLSYE